MKEIIVNTDINLDWIPHPLTGNINPLINIDSIRQSFIVLFYLNQYDIPFNQHKFVDLNRFLFENINHLTASDLVKRIEWAVKTYEKRVNLISIKVDPLDTDDGFDITVTYQIKALNITDTFSHVFQRVR